MRNQHCRVLRRSVRRGPAGREVENVEKGKEDRKEVEVSERGDTSKKSQGSEKSKCDGGREG